MLSSFCIFFEIQCDFSSLIFFSHSQIGFFFWSKSCCAVFLLKLWSQKIKVLIHLYFNSIWFHLRLFSKQNFIHRFLKLKIYTIVFLLSSGKIVDNQNQKWHVEKRERKGKLLKMGLQFIKQKARWKKFWRWKKTLKIRTIHQHSTFET